MSYRDALKGKQQQQESPTNPTILHEAPQPNQLEPMFAIMQGMMEKMFSQMTQQRKYPAEEQTEVEHLIKIDNIEVVLVSESQFVADLILTSEGMTWSIPTIHLAEHAEEQPCSSGASGKSPGPDQIDAYYPYPVPWG